MSVVRPDEVSAILRQQLVNFDSSPNLEEVGSVLQIGDGIARVYGLESVKSGELVEFENGVKAIAMNLEKYLAFEINGLRFLDSLQFLNCSLDVLSKNLLKENLS